MYYDNKNQIIINTLPKNSIGPDGNFYFNFDTANNIDLWADHNYYTIRNDTVSPGADYIEDESKRIITLNKPYADISRTWILNQSPEVSTSTSINTNIPANPSEE
jgi:hypothetical protein